MAKWEQIEQVNEVMKPTDIKGRPYIEVNERIKGFRKLYPEGFIKTVILSNANGVCVMQSKVGYYTESGEERILGSGLAYEKENSSYINKTSYIEVCETSSVGRALGMCGFGIDTSVASAEEVQNAMANQEEKKATPKQVEILQKTYTGENLKKLLKANKVEKLEDIPMQTASSIIEKLGGKK